MHGGRGATVRPMLLYYLLILTLPLMNERFLAHPLLGFTAEKWLGLACFVYAMYDWLQGRRPVRPFASAQARAYLIFFLLALASFCTISALGMRGMMLVYTSNLLFLLTTVMLVRTVERLRWTLLAATAAMALASLFMIREWLAGSALYGAAFRPGFVVGDPNYFTASVLVVLPFACYILTERQVPWERLFCLAAITVTLWAVMLSASRGGFLGLVAAAVYLIFRSRRPWRNLTLVAVLLALVLALAPNNPLKRLLHPNGGDRQSSENRLVTWQAGMRMFAAHPLLGVGLDNFKAELPHYTPAGTNVDFLAHNTYIEIAATMGLPGILVFVAILGFTFASLRRSRRLAQRVEAEWIDLTAAGLEAGLAGFAIAIFFLSAAFLKLLWFAVFISAALPALLAVPISAPADAALEAAAAGQEADSFWAPLIPEAVTLGGSQPWPWAPQDGDWHWDAGAASEWGAFPEPASEPGPWEP